MSRNAAATTDLRGCAWSRARSQRAPSARVVVVIASVLVLLIGCGPPDYDGWEDYLAAVQEKFEQTGSCEGLTELPVSMMDGDAYWAEPVGLGTSENDSFGYIYADETGGSIQSWWLSDPVDVSDGCAGLNDQSELSYRPDLGMTGALIVMSVTEGGALPLFFETSDSQDLEAEDELLIGLYRGVSEGGWDRLVVLLDQMYGWACVESAVGAQTFQPGPADWRGLVFAHAETWTEEFDYSSSFSGGTELPDDLGGGELPLDILIDLSDVDCVSSSRKQRELRSEPGVVFQ